MCGFKNEAKYPKNGGYQHCSGACATLADPIIPAQLAVDGKSGKYPEFAGERREEEAGRCVVCCCGALCGTLCAGEERRECRECGDRNFQRGPPGGQMH